jgi:hypothetical protein
MLLSWADLLALGSESFASLDIATGNGSNHVDFIRTQASHDLARAAQDHAAGRNHTASRDECACPDDAVGTNLSAIEDDGLDPNEALILDGAAMDHGLVANRDTLTHCDGESGVGMQNRTILNVGLRTNLEQIVVPPQNGVEPDRCVGRKGHTAHDLCAWGNVGRLVNLGAVCPEAVNGHDESP